MTNYRPSIPSVSSIPSRQSIASIPYIRNTFGLVDKLTGERYTDIISSHLELRYLSIDEYIKGSIRESKDRQKNYLLLLDHKTTVKIFEANKQRLTEIPVIISFQRRTTGLYAVTRLPNFPIPTISPIQERKGLS